MRAASDVEGSDESAEGGVEVLQADQELGKLGTLIWGHGPAAGHHREPAQCTCHSQQTCTTPSANLHNTVSKPAQHSQQTCTTQSVNLDNAHIFIHNTSTLSLNNTHIHSLSLTHTSSLSFSLTHTHTHTNTHTLSLCVSHSHTHTHTLPPHPQTVVTHNSSGQLCGCAIL